MTEQPNVISTDDPSVAQQHGLTEYNAETGQYTAPDGEDSTLTAVPELAGDEEDGSSSDGEELIEDAGDEEDNESDDDEL